MEDRQELSPTRKDVVHLENFTFETRELFQREMGDIRASLEDLQALAIARCQRAKSWKLRAAMNLAQLWQRQGKRAEAYELLAPVYDWFTEGFDTADRQEAKALLEALTG